MVKLIKLMSNVHASGQLVVLESGVSFVPDIQRVFVVTGKQAATRGKHAHKRLTQTLVCIQGDCRVTCDDGTNRQDTILDQPDLALEIPPGIWAEQYYAEPDTILMVLCDRHYEESDYIRNYEDFLAYRKELSK